MPRPLSIPVIERIVAFCCRWQGVVILASLLLALGASFYTATHFAMNSNSGDLISPDTAWRKRQQQFDRLFPQQSDLILVVIDGTTPELAEAAAATLTTRLNENKMLFPDVRRSDGGPFFDHNGMLFLPLKDVQATTQQLIKAQPFLGALAADPSLRGVMDSLSTVLLGVSRGQAKLSDLDLAMTQFGQVLAAAAKGQADYLSWRALITGEAPRAEEVRRFIEVRPRLFYDELEPGRRASDAIRAAASQLDLDPGHGVRVRLTGDVPLRDEEFGTLTDRVWLMISAMMAGVLATLWLALRSFKIIIAILVTLFVGLVITMGVGLFFVGVFNIISIAFIALFVGLGVDFGIQFSVRYRAERFRYPVLREALCHTGRSVGLPLALAASATAVGFFSFLPTDYTGVAELGFVAGLGMVVAFATSITLLPALLMWLSPEGEAEDVGFIALAPLDRFLARNRMPILRIAAISGVICLALTYFLRFDSNPLDLRSRKAESVSTLFDLMGNSQTSPNAINVLAPSLAKANQLAARLAELPSVDQVLTLSTFVPDDQTQKLALIADANGLLDPTLNPFDVKPSPSDAELVASFKATAAKLRDAAKDGRDEASSHARALAASLEVLANGPKANRDRATEAIVPGLKTMLRQLSDALTPGRVSLDNLPPQMKRDWVTPDGMARIQVFPKDISNDPRVLSRFSDAVLRVAPDATGAPISIRESGRTIVGAFTKAGILSFLAILVLLAAVLRRAADVVTTLAPLILAGLLTVGSCVAFNLQLNFANIIALPLLLGIGVAFNIYFTVAWRAGAKNFLQSSLTRAVIFSAATTASSFGTLWLSRHPGTASMGELLMISLFWTLVTTLFVSPALLGPPPPDREQAHEKLI
ncbi:MAG TPA: MMPL family transporter [Rhizomicrobium sp.]|nr:MMPL family transporter [Rhizomicrobium sp.]